jgi:hypothetical protein
MGVPAPTVNASCVCALAPSSIYSTVRRGPTSRVNGLDAPDQGVRQGPKWPWLGDQPNILPLDLSSFFQFFNFLLQSSILIISIKFQSFLLLSHSITD